MQSEEKDQYTPGRAPEQDIKSEGEALERSPSSNPKMDPEELAEKGLSRYRAFMQSRIPEDIGEAIECLSLALESTPEGHSSLPERHFDLGVVYGDRYRQLRWANDLEKSTEHKTRALELTPDGHSSLSDLHFGLGVSYEDRYKLLGQLDDLDKSTEYYTRALELTPDGHPDLPIRHGNLGVSYTDRYERFGQVEDIEKAIEHESCALALTPDGHPTLSKRHGALGASYGYRFMRLGQLADLEESIDHMSRALTLTPEGHPSLVERYADLGVSYANRYKRLGQLDDLDKSTEHDMRALALTPDGHPDLADRHSALGASYSDRYRRLGQLEDLEKSTEHRSRALALTPDNHSSLPNRHAGLGVSYSDRYRCLGQLEDLEKSTEHKLRALALTPDDHPLLPDRHAAVGVSYMDRYRRLGQVKDLEKSTEHFSCALVLTPDDHPSLSHWHAALGTAYGNRYQRLGQVDDLEKSTEHRTRALALTPEGHPDLADRHAALGVSYSDRYRRLGQLSDLDKSTEHDMCALALTPDSHPDLSDRHAALGVSHTDRYRLLGQLEDLEKSTKHRSRALALTPEGHSDLAYRNFGLGVCYSDRYKRLGQPEDLEKSTQQFSRALALTPDGHPDLSDRHAALGVSYSDRYRRLGQLDDLEKLAEHTSRALALTPQDHPDCPVRHLHRAYAFWHQYQHTGDSSYLTHTVASFRNASQLLTGSPRDRFLNALAWANFAAQNLSISLNLLEAYQTTIDLLPQFASLGATTHQRYQDLVTVENLAIRAASAAILHDDHKLALEWLEHARCVVWNQTLMLRSPIEDLRSSDPDLAARLLAIAQQLHDAGSVSSSQNSPSDTVDPEQIGKRRRRLAMEYEDLLTKARALPGFEDYLQPIRADRLVTAACNGPIAVINCHEDRCDALLVSPGKANIQHLPLTSFTQDKAKSARLDLETSLRNKGVRERGFRVRQAMGDNDSIGRVLLTLWTDVVKPVLDHLGYLENVPVHNLPHITWCPTGALSFLPLHAAGDYAQPGSRVFDYAVSSYVPTLTALLASAPKSSEHPLRVLAIGQEDTPGHSPLPGTTTELECVANRTQDKADYAQLTGSEATTVDVLDAMDIHDWVHLACHAHQNVEDPTKSGFFLHDGTLDLTAINRRSFKNKGLAFLSACQTATGDEKLPDEAIHLASGMLMAGYPSVIATMWSVVDDDASFVADKVYAHLMRGGRVGNGEAARALHHAVAALREKVGENEFSNWAPYIHIGS